MNADDPDFRALARCLHETLADPEIPGPPEGGKALRYFGDYVLEEEIARGGMGIVYRARQISLDRVVAVKVLRDSALSSGPEIERFRVEAGAAAALRHPHIVRVHEIGEHAGTHFFSMDYVAGSTLAHALQAGPLPARTAAALLVKIARAIHHAHSQGVLHRDIKPGNVLLDAEGEPVITDFGLARHAAAEVQLTLTGQVLGTPAYMAPEQAQGRSRDTGPHTDVYGLGALLYHLLTGRPPFAGASHLDIIGQVLSADAVSVRLLNPSVPRDLQTICARAMMREMPRRYPSAEAMAEDVQRFLDGRPVLARPVGPAGKAWRWARRHRMLAATGTLAILALAAVAVISSIAAERMKTSRDAEARARSAAEALIKDMLIGMRDKLQPLNRVELLEDAAAAAERYFTDLPAPLAPETEQQQAAMLETRSDVFYALADVPAAVQKQRASLEIIERLLHAEPSSRTLRYDAAHAGQSLAWLLGRQGDLRQALPLRSRSLELLDSLVRDYPEEATLRRSRTMSACSLAAALAGDGQNEKAIALLAPLVAAGESLDSSPPADSDTAWDSAAELRIHLGDALAAVGRPADAMAEYRRALTRAEKADARKPGLLSHQRRLITALERITDVLLEADDFPGARAMAERRLTISQAVASADPANLQHRADVAAAHGRLSAVASRMKDRDAGLAHARQARASYDLLLALDPDHKPWRHETGSLWLDEAALLGDTDDASSLAAFLAARKIFASLSAEDPDDPEWRRALMVSYLNATALHLLYDRPDDAQHDNDAASELNTALRRDFPDNDQFRRDAGRIEGVYQKIAAARNPR